MSLRTLGLSEAVYQYLMQVGLREPDVLRSVREETARLPDAHIQIAPEQGQLMALLVHLTSARICLEIGTFTGYSALALALALPPEGRIVTCEIDPTFAAMAREHWQRAKVARKIDLRLGPALGTLDQMLQDGEWGRFDLVFIDADKENILAYYERCLALTNGLLLIDNTLWGGVGRGGREPNRPRSGNRSGAGTQQQGPLGPAGRNGPSSDRRWVDPCA
jgi:predicted O-methyltransferase YrrM